MPLKHFLALPLFALTATTAFAQDSTMCRNGLFPTEPPFALAEVNGTDRAYFHSDMNGCPWTRGACSSPSYVIPGDQVLISKIRNGYACAFYPRKGGGTAGWIPARQLTLQRVDTKPPLSAWLGTWSSEGNPEVTFTARLGALNVSGEAFWPGRPGTTDWPSIHVGEIGGAVSRMGHIGKYQDDNLCEVRFTLLGPFLIAGDNRQCGGANVSFSAVYRRAEN